MLAPDQKYYWVTGQKSGKQIDIKAVQKANAKRLKVCLAEQKGSNKPNLTKEEWDINANTILVVPKVTVYDEGQREHIKVVAKPFESNLLYISGPLLQQDESFPNLTDRHKVFDGNQFNIQKYNQLIEERVLPALLHINEMALAAGKKAVIGMPGLGCGAFATYEVKDTISDDFFAAIRAILQKHSNAFPAIGRIEFSSKDHIKNQQVGDIKLHRGKNYPGLNIQPQKGEKSFRIVAWDPLSAPGNEYWVQSKYLTDRSSDDPISILSTNILEIITGIKGKYYLQEQRFIQSDNEQYLDNTVAINKIMSLLKGISHSNLLCYDTKTLHCINSQVASHSIAVVQSDIAEQNSNGTKAFGYAAIGVGVISTVIGAVCSLYLTVIPVIATTIPLGILIIGLSLLYCHSLQKAKSAPAIQA
jgi:hypothetical protein